MLKALVSAGALMLGLSVFAANDAEAARCPLGQILRVTQGRCVSKSTNLDLYSGRRHSRHIRRSRHIEAQADVSKSDTHMTRRERLRQEQETRAEDRAQSKAQLVAERGARVAHVQLATNDQGPLTNPALIALKEAMEKAQRNEPRVMATRAEQGSQALVQASIAPPQTNVNFVPVSLQMEMVPKTVKTVAIRLAPNGEIVDTQRDADRKNPHEMVIPPIGQPYGLLSSGRFMQRRP